MLELWNRTIRRAIDIRQGEGRSLFFSAAYYYLLLCSYYIIRPIRDDMGAAGGVDNLAWLFTGTLIGMLLMHPIYTALVSRMPRRQFISWVYRFFMLQLLLFYGIFQLVDGNSEIWTGRIFFIWTSVFNLFIVSVFWSLINDIFRPHQSKRLFGVIAVGGTAGALTGSTITTALTTVFMPITLLLISALLMEIAVRVSRYLGDQESTLALAETDDEEKTAQHNNTEKREAIVTQIEQKQRSIIGGDVMEGARHVIRSPYLLGIALLMLFFTIVSTYLYFQQIAIVNEVYGDDSQGRTQLFAMRDLATNAITLIVQLFFTGRILKWLGTGLGLALLPIISFIGFALLAVSPVLAVVIIFDTLRRAGNFALQRPARESLYTVVSRTDKYKAKNFNDTFVYRAGDQLGAWSYTAMAWMGLGLSGLAITMLPVSALWCLLALWLGKQYQKQLHHSE